MLKPLMCLNGARTVFVAGAIADNGLVANAAGATASALCELHSSQRLIDIGNNVVRMLDTDRKPYISLSHAGLELLLR